MGIDAGIDLGATSIRAVVGTTDRIRGRDRRATPGDVDGRTVAREIVASLDAACEGAGVDPAAVERLGIGAIGPLDRELGVVRDPANLAITDGTIPIAAALERVVEAPIVLLNDAVAGLVADRAERTAPPPDHVYLTISTGIGAGVCVDWDILTGGAVGEVGHVPVDPAGEMRCGCGARGHWEAYCSGRNLPAYARHLAAAGDRDTSLALDDGLTAADVLAATDDALASHVRTRMTHWNVRGVATVCAAFGPELVSVGGAVARHHSETVLGPIRARLADHVADEPPRLQPSPLDDWGVARGALLAAARGIDED